MLRGIRVDEVYPMLEAWKDGGVSSRKAELLLAGEPTDNLVDRVENG